MLKKIFLIIIIATAVFFGLAWKKLNNPADPDGADRIFTVSAGEGTNQISDNLFGQKLIKSKLAFETYVWARGWEGTIKAGEHTLSPKLNIREIAQSLVSGNTISSEEKIIVKEGWNIGDIDSYLSEKNILASGEFKNVVDKISNFPARDGSAPGGQSSIPKSYIFLNALSENTSLEGYLFPDTYRVFKNSSAEEIAGKMLANFDRKLNPELRVEIERQGKSVHEIITMASLIEKEVRATEDMKIVSGIFWNRINNGQALQSCATLAYVLGVNKPQYSEADTKIDSPYNTYQNKGLPPGPIANPGMNAIKAAIYPTANDYNFFLTAEVNGESKTIYSRTFEEHVRNKGIYLK
ncbi:MAG: endolytic transglycosylase MltG [Patescibacteria group bacterium]|jgi:UPF0755 protein